MIDRCPQCGLSNMYQDAELWICADCGLEVSANETQQDVVNQVKDAFGNVLSDGDSVVLVKDLKVKGGEILKLGTKVRNIKLKPDGGHNIDCKIDGVGMMLKSEFVKKG